MGKLIGIAYRTASRGEMFELQSVEITPESGTTNDFRGTPGRRQVTVLSVEDWNAACQELDVELSWTTRRANLLVEGLSLKEQVGQFIQIGSVALRITCETEPCHRMEEAQPGLLDALNSNWRGGVCCTVVEGGTIAVGDIANLFASVASNPG